MHTALTIFNVLMLVANLIVVLFIVLIFIVVLRQPDPINEIKKLIDVVLKTYQQYQEESRSQASWIKKQLLYQDDRLTMILDNQTKMLVKQSVVPLNCLGKQPSSPLPPNDAQPVPAVEAPTPPVE